MVHRCGQCLLFNTAKCTWLYSYEPKKKTKEIHSWKEFVEWLYTIENTPLPHINKLVRNTILPTDYACAHFIKEREE
jgi:hypothetical protein